MILLPPQFGKNLYPRRSASSLKNTMPQMMHLHSFLYANLFSSWSLLLFTSESFLDLARAFSGFFSRHFLASLVELVPCLANIHFRYAGLVFPFIRDGGRVPNKGAGDNPDCASQLSASVFWSSGVIGSGCLSFVC